MKNIKKLLSIVMVLTLVLALGAQAFAATITVPDELSGHKLVAYQIFSGTQLEGDAQEKLASIDWGSGIDSATFIQKLIAAFPESGFAAGMSAKDVAEKLKGITDKSGDAEKLADAAAASIVSGKGIEVTAGGSVPDGYYIITDETETLNGNAAYNDVVLQVTGNVNIEWKSDVPKSEKKVQDDTDTKWQDSADWDIGDAVPFQITGTLPTNYGDYDTYYVAFHDKQEAGLNAPAEESFAVTVGGVALEKGQYSVSIPGTDGCTFDVVIENLKSVAPAAKAGDQIVVTYTSVLNEHANIGYTGNKNTSHMEFSNNPNGEQHGNTKDDTVIVFTYELDVNKVDGDNAPLAGAGFTLLKKVTAGGEDITLNEDTPYEYTYTGVEKVAEFAAGEQTLFEFKGLDDGEYILVESTVPDGYNKADDIEFKVEATHDETSDDPKLLTFTASGDLTVKENATPGEGETALTGKLSTNVQNLSGLELPETGGIGTTIFYVVGGILVAAAVILLVTRKRVSGAEK